MAMHVPMVMNKEALGRLRELASTYRTLIFLVVIDWACYATSSSMNAHGNPVAAGFGFAAIGLAIFVAVFGYRIAKILDLAIPPLWAIGMFIPVVNLIVLLMLSRSATDACRRSGVRVGLLGPDGGDLLRIQHSLEATEAARAAQAAQAAHAAQTGAPPR
jgi:hypothetical protein